MIILKKLIPIVSLTFNEEENIPNFYNHINKLFKDISTYNASTDFTIALLKNLAEKIDIYRL